MNVTELWARLTPKSLTAATFCGDGIALGDLGGLLLVADRSGTVVGERPLPAPIHDISATPDDKTLAVCCGAGEIQLIEDGSVRWCRTLDPAPTMVRIGPHGDYLLALARNGLGAFLNRFGREMAEIDVPGGADFVALALATGHVVAVRDDGLIQGFTSWGKPLWETMLHRSVGRVATDNEGELVIMPAMSFGAEAITSRGTSVGAYEVGEPVKATAVSGNGKILLVVTTRDRLIFLDRKATVLHSLVFNSPVDNVQLDATGTRVLVTTGSGYAHLLGISDSADGPLLEMEGGAGSIGGPRPLFTERVFSPFSLMMQARAVFSNDGDLLAIAGDRQRIQVFNPEGREVARRRFGGNLLTLDITGNGTVRVFANKSVFSFRPGVDGTRMEWAEISELTRVIVTADDEVTALTEDAEILRFGAPGDPPRSLFHLETPEAADIAVSGSSLAALLKTNEIVVHAADGRILGRSGPWPVRPRLLASSRHGFLVGVEKLVTLITPLGEEAWQRHLPAPAREGMALIGTFLVLDGSGTAHSVTDRGVIHRAFSAGKGGVVPFRDAGEGPGFLVTDGSLLAAVHPDGRTRWRHRFPDDIVCVTPAPDGQVAAVLSGLDLTVLPLVSDTCAPTIQAERTTFMEFADG